MAFRYSLNNNEVANIIEEAIKNFISKGLRTHDIASDATFLRTDQVAPKLIDIIEEISSAR